MKTSDEWLVIGGGIGLVVLLFAIFNKANATQAPYSAPAAAPASISNPNFTSAAPQTPPNFPGLTFNPPVENISIGPTSIGGSTFNTGNSNLFPFFGYAVQSSGQSSGLPQVYNTINALMGNNANYQAGQNAGQQNYLNNAGQNNSQYLIGGGSGIMQQVGG